MTVPRDIPLYISSGDDDMMVAFPPATKPSHCSMPFMVLRWYPCWRRKGQQNTLPNINRVHVILFLWQQQDRSADPVMMTYLRIGYQCITTHCSHDVSENFILWQCHGGRFSANGKPHYTTWFCGDLFIEGKKCKRIRSPALPLDWFVRFFSFLYWHLNYQNKRLCLKSLWLYEWLLKWLIQNCSSMEEQSRRIMYSI